MVMTSLTAYHFWKFLMKNMIPTNSGLMKDNNAKRAAAHVDIHSRNFIRINFHEIVLSHKKSEN